MYVMGEYSAWSIYLSKKRFGVLWETKCESIIWRKIQINSQRNKITSRCPEVASSRRTGGQAGVHILLTTRFRWLWLERAAWLRSPAPPGGTGAAVRSWTGTQVKRSSCSSRFLLCLSPVSSVLLCSIRRKRASHGKFVSGRREEEPAESVRWDPETGPCCGPTTGSWTSKAAPDNHRAAGRFGKRRFGVQFGGPSCSSVIFPSLYE